MLAFIEGKAGIDESARVVEHLSDCDDCLSAVGASEEKRSDSDPGEAKTPSGVGFRAKDVIAGRYEIQRFMARGGMGEVYDAEDRLLGGRVALKTVLLEDEDNARSLDWMRREVKAARAINHPAVCRVFDLGEHPPPGSVDPAGRRFFLTMEFLEGVTLGQHIRANGALDPTMLLAVSRQLADGLAAAHGAGVVHRDFKSDNVMLVPSPRGAPPAAKIMDFGLARHGPKVSSLASVGGAMVGSAAYMAPEQVQGLEVKESADVYAFGVVLFEAATGKLPFLVPDSVFATAAKRLFEDPPSPRDLAPTLDPRIEALILRCLRRSPPERFASMKEICGRLNRIAEDSVATLLPPVQVAKKRPVARQTLWPAMGAAAIIATALFLMFHKPRVSNPKSEASPPASAGGAPSIAANPGAGEPPTPPLIPVEVPPPQPATAVNAPPSRPVRRGNKRPAPPSGHLATFARPPVDEPGGSVAPAGARSVPDSGTTTVPLSRSPLDGFRDPFAHTGAPR